MRRALEPQFRTPSLATVPARPPSILASSRTLAGTVAIRRLVLALGLVAPSLATAGELLITVTTVADENGTGTGCSLREAIVSANTDTEFGGCDRVGSTGEEVIELPGGESSPGLTYAIVGSGLTIDGDVSLVGTGSFLPRVDGNGGLFFLLSLQSGTVRLSGIELREGGLGGLFVNAGVLGTLESALVVANSGNGGAGIRNFGDLTLVDSSIGPNVAQTEGGGIANFGQLQATRTVIIGNDVSGTSGRGGGIYNGGGLELELCEIVENETLASGRGGGVFNDAGSTLLIANSRIEANSTSSGNGGGIAAEGGIIAIASATFVGNVAGGGGFQGSSGGGLFVLSDSTTQVTLTQNTFSGNRATANGGGVAIFSTAGFQGPTLSFNTFTANIADDDVNQMGDAGGVHVTAGENPVLMVGNLLAENVDESTSPPSAIVPDCAGGAVYLSQGRNLIGDGTGCSFPAGTGDLIGTSGSPIDAQLGPLRHNFGPTETHLPAPTSPAVDAAAATCTGIAGGLDQRGLPRPQDGDANGSEHCDIGAVELGIFAGGFESGGVDGWSAAQP